MLGNISNENLESATGILLFVFIRSLLVFILESLKTALCCLVVCWESSGTSVVYSDLSSSYSDELRSEL